jgi:hypothetical protein
MGEEKKRTSYLSLLSPHFSLLKIGASMYALLIAAMQFQVAAPGIEPTFIAASPNEKGSSGRIVRLNPDFTLVLTEGLEETTVKGVYSLRQSDRTLPPLPTGPQLITTTGDRIAGKLVGGDELSLQFLPSGIKLKPEEAWRVPLSSVSVLWLATTPADTPTDTTQYEWLTGNRNRDIFRFRNGDTDKGTLTGLDAEGVFNFRPDEGMARTIRADQLAAVGFNPALARTRKPKGAYARLVLADSSRIAVVSATVADNILHGETLFGTKVAIPVADLVSMDVINGKAAHLSDLKPKKVEQTGFLSTTWPWGADRSVQGKPLRVATSLGESTFDKGLGTRPRTALAFDLGGRYHWFEAVVGLDPAVATGGRVAVRVVVDGKVQEIADLAELKAGTAIPVRVNIAGAKELVLITDFAPQGGAGAEVNWCDARVVE